MCAEVVASELHMPLVVARLDAIIASHLGETASNLRKLFDAAKSRSMVLFLDEFDALARARSDATEHSEIRRVVNSLLMMIDRFEGKSILIAATNLEEHVDRAIWRRFDELVVFEKPTIIQIRRLLSIKTRNFPANFDITKFADRFVGMSYAEVERTCLSAIRTSILGHASSISEHVFKAALEHETRRSKVESTILG
jgi:AAA+ superfamily predicted ATPase